MHETMNKSYVTAWSNRVSTDVRRTLEARRAAESQEKRRRQGLRRMFMLGLFLGVALTKFLTPVAVHAAQL
jgi:uncharacterized membrane protein YoaK (UPF0700 family)